MTRGPLIACLAAIVAAPLALEATLGTHLEALVWSGGFGAPIVMANILPQSGPPWLGLHARPRQDPASGFWTVLA